MYTPASESHDVARLTVADILSTMASTVDAMTPTTLSLLDGLTGVPTRTTPTLTPTTLRNIEQTFMDLAANQISHEHEAGFVPPLVPNTHPYVTASSSSASTISSSNYTVTVTTATQQGSTCIIDLNHAGKDSMKRWLGVSVSSQVGNNSGGPQRGRRMSVGSSSSSNSSYSSAAVSYTSTNRKGGGRRKEDRDNEDGPPEEVVKRRMRRERNKLAAARCRKRRLDHTMALQQETEHWEEKKQIMQNEIRQLQKEKEELEMLLDAHRSQCKIRKISHPSTTSSAGHFASKIIPDLCPIIKRPQPQQVTVKEEHQESEDSYLSDESQLDSYDSSHLPANMFSQVGQQNKIEFTKPAPRPRPTSLPVASPFSQHMARSSTTGVSEIAGIAITTPSSGIPGFNFDSLMEGGTGLTPVVPSPSCSTQQRSSALPVDLSSPEAVNRKLVSL